MTNSILPPGSVPQGGKEELRAATLKTYLLRVRAEKGDSVADQLLRTAGIGASLLDNETGWISSAAAKRALRGIAEQLGGVDALKSRGSYVTHPESLGQFVRMLRVAQKPADAYRYLATHARELSRIGAFVLEELDGNDRVVATLPATGADLETTATINAAMTAGRSRQVDKIRMTYRLLDMGEDGERPDLREEGLLCAVRIAELAGFPSMWGLPEATVTHSECLAKGKDACVYHVAWENPGRRRVTPFSALGAAVVFGGAAAATGHPVVSAISAILGAVLGGGTGLLWDRGKADEQARVFEKNRIAALERGLELKGEAAEQSPGELGGVVLGGKYRIGRKIGSGGIGVVYAAEHTTLGHEVAVKVLRGAAARDAGEVARLRREAYIQVHVDHPNIARVFDLDQMPDGSIYVVMERLLGKSLADKLARDRLIAPGYAIPVFIGVCRALSAAHDKDIVHRDLKPGNIFLCDDGNSKVLDFGMSKLTTAESLTQAGYTLGTPEYMAPEQCIGAAVEARTDLYALGVLMYEALTGELPITAATRRELLDLHQRQIPTPMRIKRPDLPIPDALDHIIMQCLRKRIHERPQSALVLAEMLESLPRDGLALNYTAAQRKPPETAPARGADHR